MSNKIEVGQIRYDRHVDMLYLVCEKDEERFNDLEHHKVIVLTCSSYFYDVLEITSFATDGIEKDEIICTS
jgi:hypothetical protein